jgi:hypothetical protein
MVMEIQIDKKCTSTEGKKSTLLEKLIQKNENAFYLTEMLKPFEMSRCLIMARGTGGIESKSQHLKWKS